MKCFFIDFWHFGFLFSFLDLMDLFHFRFLNLFSFSILIHFLFSYSFFELFFFSLSFFLIK